MVKESVNPEAQKDTTGKGEEDQKQGTAQEPATPMDPAAEVEEKKEAEEGKELTAEEKLAELQDKYLRLSAEYDNFRKRTLREKIELQKSANLGLLEALLPVADDFDRALQSVDEAREIGALKEGLNLIRDKFNGFLGQQGVREMDSVHREFDTDMHEAITKIPAPNKKLKGKVVDVIQKGYFLNDRVLRHAKVVIGE